MKQYYQENQLCPRCQKPFYATACMACGGKSYHRHLLVLKRICERCKGIGQEYYCPDQSYHNEDDSVDRRQRIFEEWIRSYGKSATY